jgi:pimeloyl-ACP methyl ester carboxylesterase
VRTATRTRLALPAGQLELLDVRGETPALLLLHEGLGSIGLWRTFPHELAVATGCRTIAFSRFGHGRSGPAPSPRTGAFMHEEALEVLPAVIDRLELDLPLLVGHSDGASIALIYASNHPLRGVVAIAPHVFVEERCVRGIERTREAYLRTGLRERLAAHHRDPDAVFYGWSDVWLDSEFRSWDIRELIPRVKCPMLLVQGERDQYATMAQLDAIQEAARAPVERVHLDADHSPHLERRRETIAAVARFVERIGQ